MAQEVKPGRTCAEAHSPEPKVEGSNPPGHIPIIIIIVVRRLRSTSKTSCPEERSDLFLVDRAESAGTRSVAFPAISSCLDASRRGDGQYLGERRATKDHAAAAHAPDERAHNGSAIAALRGQERNTCSTVRASQAHLHTPRHQALPRWRCRRAGSTLGGPSAGNPRAGVGYCSVPCGRPGRSSRESHGCSPLYRQDSFQSMDWMTKSKCCRGVMDTGEKKLMRVSRDEEHRGTLVRRGVGLIWERKS